MIEFFFKGGFLFMGILTLILLLIVIGAMNVLISFFSRKMYKTEETLKNLNYIKSIGIFAMFFGILGQLVGLFSAFRAIKFDDIELSPIFIVDGFKISMITTVYGILIFSFSILVWFVSMKVLDRSVLNGSESSKML